MTKKREEIYRIITILYVIVLFIINFIRIFDDNFWGDEAYSINLAKMSFEAMIGETASDVHPPLYYIFLMTAYRILGNSGWVYHIVSLIPYTLIIIFAMNVIYKDFGKEASILLMTFSSILTTSLTYNIEVRMYSWTCFFVLMSYYFFYKIIGLEKKSYYLIFTIMSLAAAYSHYYGIISVGFLYVILLVLAIRKKIQIKNILYVYLITVISYLPWLYILITTFQRTADNFWIEKVPSLKDILIYYFSVQGKEEYSVLMVVITLLLVIIMIFKNLGISFKNNRNTFQWDHKKGIVNFSDKKPLTSINIWMISGVITAFGTAAVGVAVSFIVRPVFITRYLYPAAIILWMVLCISVSQYKKAKPVLFTLILAVTLIICIPSYCEMYKNEALEGKRCKETEAYMEENISNTDIMLTNVAPLGWTVLQCYFPEISYRHIGLNFNKFTDSDSYWLLWNSEINDDAKNWLYKNGYEAKEQYKNAYLGDAEFHIYKLEKL